MLAVAISLLFGLVAFAALAQIVVSIGHGARRARLIHAELSRGRPPVKRTQVLRVRSQPRRLAAA